MILCFDIGNTHIVMGIVDKNEIKETYRFATNTTITEDEYASLEVDVQKELDANIAKADKASVDKEKEIMEI